MRLAAPGPARTGGRAVLIPLRGRRRALGSVVIDRVRHAAWSDAALLSHAVELGAEISLAIENVHLLHGVIEARQELENIFDSTVDLVAVCDSKLRIMLANRAFVVRTGGTLDTVRSQSLHDLLGPQICQWVTSLHEAGGSEVVPARETDDERLGGTFSVTLSRVSRQTVSPAGVVLVAHDVTERTRLEAERTALRERLAQSEKLAALGQFVGGIADEINNPLQAIVGHIDLLRATEPLSKSATRDAKTIAREAERAAQIIRNLLTFNGARPLTSRPVSLHAAVKRALAVGQGGRRPAGIEVVTTLDAAMPRVAAEPMLLRQAVLNVLSNAELAVRDRRRRRIEIATRYRPRQRRATLRIRDTGPGIAPDALPHVFEPFYTTRSVGEGTGLGLAIAYGLISGLGGAITASNDRRGGAVFTITLPIPGLPSGKSRKNSLK